MIALGDHSFGILLRLKYVECIFEGIFLELISTFQNFSLNLPTIQPLIKLVDIIFSGESHKMDPEML
jgi:hypothetical protein